MRERGYDEAPREVAALSPQEAWAYGYNMALHDVREVLFPEMLDAIRVTDGNPDEVET